MAERKVIVGFFVALAAICIIALICAGAGYAYTYVDSKNFNVGSTVHMSFVGNPAVLTTALWGPNKEYSSESNYGTSTFLQDTTNALHCDMPGGYGIYSTWLSNAGLNWQANESVLLASNSQLYFNGVTCSSEADCVSTSVACGPGFIATDQTTTYWNSQINSKQPYYMQCPPNSWCSLCEGPNGCDTTKFGSDAIGSCINLNFTGSLQFQCNYRVPYYPENIPPAGRNETNVTYQTFCSAIVPDTSTANSGPFNAYTPCNPQNNLSTLCSQPINENKWYCQWLKEGRYPSTFNPDCGNSGLQCVPNWSQSVTGWCPTTETSTTCTGWGPSKTVTTVPQYCPPNDNIGTTNSGQWGTGANACKSSGYTFVAENVCSGTAVPTVQMNTTWTAEGEVINTYSGGYVDVQWKRVRNMYEGIGPSDKMFPDGTSGWNGYDYNAKTDKSWVYADCRFIRDDSQWAENGKGATSRNYSVSKAILGYTSVSTVDGSKQVFDPVGWSVFLEGTQSLSILPIESILWIGSSTGVNVYVGGGTFQNSGQPNQQSAWQLTSSFIDTSLLTKTTGASLGFTTIPPMEGNEEGVRSLHQSLMSRNFRKAPKLHVPGQ